jgi:prepilin-type N-terminal cleavage/methylation domain-containing protein
LAAAARTLVVAMGMTQFEGSPMRGHRGFTLIEVMIVMAVIALLAMIAVPNVLRGRVNAHEAAAIGNLRVLISSLEMHRASNGMYPDGANWQPQMYGADCDPATPPSPDFGPQTFCLAMNDDAAQGYRWTYAGGAAPASAFTILAVPQVPGVTGRRSFFGDQSGGIRHCAGTGTAAGMVDDPRIDEPVQDC